MLFHTLNIDPEKEDRIVKAATRIFAQHGYQNASTNAIVKEANISKGLLFHYFSSKKDLYLSLFDHLSSMLLEKIYDQVDWNEQDIFIKLRQVAVLKQRLFKVYPDMFNFLNRASKEDSKEVISDINQKTQALIASSFNKLFADIDISKFKEGMNIPKAIDVIYWTLEGFGMREQAKLGEASVDQIDFDTVMKEMDSYIELLRTSFYK